MVSKEDIDHLSKLFRTARQEFEDMAGKYRVQLVDGLPALQVSSIAASSMASAQRVVMSRGGLPLR